MGAFHGIANIRRSQVVQEDREVLVVRLEPENPGEPVDTKTLHANLEQCLGSEVRILFDVGRSVDLPSGSKFRWVVSRVSDEPERSVEVAE